MRILPSLSLTVIEHTSDKHTNYAPIIGTWVLSSFAKVKNEYLCANDSSLFFFLSFFLFRAAPAAYGSPQTRGGIGAAPARAMIPPTAVWDPSHIFELGCTFQQHQILNPLSEARDRTPHPHGYSQVLNLLSHYGNSSSAFCFLFS